MINMIENAITNNIYFTDIVDVLIITVIAYAVILFLKQTRSITAFLGIGVIGILYTVARVFHLYITTLLLQAFFSIFIIILVIVFQDELKRSFELIITSPTRRIKNKNIVSFSATIFSITQSVSNMMRKKHGALIVIPGTELTERHTKGGNTLDGLITSAILESIFDPKSPGHDGAVVIDKNRIVKFGAHLPLSQNIKEIKEKGTRHSAGLGISEKTDALIIIVSEERGEVSIAKNGKIKTLKNVQELEKYLNTHYQEMFPVEEEPLFKKVFRDNIPQKIAAVTIASVAWFFIVFQAEIVQRDFSIPISYVNISEEKIIEQTTPETVTVTLSARGQATLSSINTDSLRLAISGDNLTAGINEIEIERGQINHPFNVSVVNISPSIITVEVKEYSSHEIPVQIVTTNGNTRFIVKETAVTPNTIKVLVPKGETPVEYLETEELSIRHIFETTTLESRVILPEHYILHQGATRRVNITLEVEEVTENNNNKEDN